MYTLRSWTGGYFSAVPTLVWGLERIAGISEGISDNPPLSPFRLIPHLTPLCGRNMKAMKVALLPGCHGIWVVTTRSANGSERGKE
jgi:hypothetical protein